MPDEIVSSSAVALATAISASELSVVDCAAAHLDRIEETNPAINAIVSPRSRDDVLAEAAAMDSHVASGAELGPLYGLPVAVKDLEDVAGLPTRSGSTVTSSHPAAADGPVAAKLRAAGALIIGKTNTPEFGTGSHTFNDVYGLTRNPWNLNRSAGGSSGGAAAALAARMVPVADGSDFGGSLRNPAAFCNVVGMRPTIGRVAEPNARSSHLMRLGVRGPMGRSVADTALVLSALAGPHPHDPLSLGDDPATFSAPLPQVTTARLAYAGDLGMFRCEPQVLERCLETASRITQAGGSLHHAQPDLTEAMMIFRTLRGLSYRDLGTRLGDRVLETKQTVQENVAFGRTLGADEVIAAEVARANLYRTMARFFDDYDVLALPAAQVAPFPAEWEYPTSIDGVDMVDYLDWMTTCCVITATGGPAISIPAGFTNEGLPVGLQLVARPGADRQLLEIAAALESHDRANLPPLTYR